MRIRYDAEFLHNVRSCLLYLYSRYRNLYIQEIRIFIANKAERQTKDIVIHRHGTASERFPRASNDSLSDPLHPPGGRNVGPSVTG